MKDASSLNYQTLVNDIFEGVRDMARRIPDVSNDGRMRISFRPCTEEADLFLGGIGGFNRRQYTGISGCISLPDDPTVYTFEKPIQASFQDDKIVKIFGRNSFSLSVIVKKREELHSQIEGKVFAQSDWLIIDLTVSGGKTKHECLECASVLSGIVEGFFLKYSKAGGYESGTWTTVDQRSKKG